MRRIQRRRRSDHHPAPSSERWLVSYADFVTLLFAVFVVLFAFSLHSKQNMHTVSSAIQSGFDALGASRPPKSPNEPQDVTKAGLVPESNNRFDTNAIEKQLQGVLGDAISRQEIVMQQTPDGLVISLRELGFFNSGGATLLPGAAEKLQDTAKVLMQNGLNVRVEGHSDDQPIHNATFQSNWELSSARAMSVLSMLIDDAGFPPSRISVAGYGAYRPVADNSTPEGRRQNRRVDLVVIAPKTARTGD